MTERKYYFCIEENKDQYRKYYISIDGVGNLNYEVLNLYTLEEIDFILKIISEEQILTRMHHDNVLYSLEQNKNIQKTHLSIRYQDNGKERTIERLSQECLLFDIEDFLLNGLHDINKKSIYNNLGGYLNNPRVSEAMKVWIKNFRKHENEQILMEFQQLPYIEQRKIKKVIYGVLTILDQKKIEENYSRKKGKEKDAA